MKLVGLPVPQYQPILPGVNLKLEFTIGLPLNSEISKCKSSDDWNLPNNTYGIFLQVAYN